LQGLDFIRVNPAVDILSDRDLIEVIRTPPLQRNNVFDGSEVNVEHIAVAILCCTNKPGENRPNQGHKDELMKRFGDNVLTTEEAPPNNHYIRIRL